MKYLIINFFLLLLFFSACKEKEKAVVEETFRPVRYTTIGKASSSASHTFSGTSQSSKETNLSFKVAGTINKLRVKVGDKVKRGQTIASLDAIDYSIEYDQAVTKLKSAETQIKAAETERIASKSNYGRIEKLYENNSIPLSEYEQARASYEASESQYEGTLAQFATAKKQVEAAKNQVNYARLSAPFTGVITAVNVEENELVSSGSAVAVLNAEGRPEVRVGIPESFIGQIRKGQEVDIQFSISPDRMYKGKISEVAFSASEASTYPVIIQIANPGEDIRPGMAVNVTFAMGQTKKVASVLMAPAKAVGEGVDGHFSFVLQPQGELYIAKKVKIEIGTFLSNGFEIKSGLKQGDLVATAGLQLLLDGMKVRLLKE